MLGFLGVRVGAHRWPVSIDVSRLILRLEHFGEALAAAAMIPSLDDARWKPTPQDWSILEICCHLLDEEREDFRVRLRSTLRDPTAHWPSLELDGISERRGYVERDLRSTVASFVAERRESVAWLRTLGDPDWRKAYVHQKFGPIAAGSLLASWAAHDALHLRQIAKRLHQLAARDGGGFSIAYAGEWRA